MSSNFNPAATGGNVPPANEPAQNPNAINGPAGGVNQVLAGINAIRQAAQSLPAAGPPIASCESPPPTTVTLNPNPEVLIPLLTLPPGPIPAAPPAALPAPPAGAAPQANVVMTANGNPPGGVYGWGIVFPCAAPPAGAGAGGAPAGGGAPAAPAPPPPQLAAQFLNTIDPGNNAQATIETIAGAPRGGSCDVTVSYTQNGQTPTATSQCHVVSVEILNVAANPLGPNPHRLLPWMLKPFGGAFGIAAANGASIRVDAAGLPAQCNDQAGAYAWQPSGNAHGRLAAAQPGIPPSARLVEADPANVASPPYVSVAPARFQVNYTLHGVQVPATTDLDILPGCSLARWDPAAAPNALAACDHEADHEWPGGAVVIPGPGAWPPLQRQPIPPATIAVIQLAAVPSIAAAQAQETAAQAALQAARAPVLAARLGLRTAHVSRVQANIDAVNLAVQQAEAAAQPAVDAANAQLRPAQLALQEAQWRRDAPNRLNQLPNPPIPQNWPLGGFATLAPAPYPHHHGSICPICSALQHGIVEHRVDPFGAAVADMLELRNQFLSCNRIWTAVYNAAGGGPPQKEAMAALAVSDFAAAQGWLWLVDTPYARGPGAAWAWPVGSPDEYINFRSVNLQGKMFGVLRGTDAGGNQVKLRAHSGSVDGLTPDGTGHHPYWSPALPNAQIVHSASNLFTNYAVLPVALALGPTFGICAATKLLSHALHLGIRIDSMAEMWIGAAAAGPPARTDGQLQTSCDECRKYLGKMLCEFGGNPRSDPYVAPGGGAPDPNGPPPNGGF